MLKTLTIERLDAPVPIMDESIVNASLLHQAETATGPELERVLDAVLMLPLAVTICLESDCSLDAYKGSTFHGGFGQGLTRAAPEVAARFFLLGDEQQSRPFAIEPPSSERTEFSAGELLTFRITLFGDAVSEGPALVAAIKAWGQLGLGSRRTPFSLVDVAVSPVSGTGFSLCPEQIPELQALAAPLSAWLAALQPQRWRTVLIQAETRLRLQHHGQLLLQAPTAQQLRAAVARRLAAVAAMAAPELHVDARMLLANLPALEGCALIADHSRFADWQRYSLREERHQPLGGLLGAWRYSGDVALLIPWLEVGQWLLLGNKTTFGFGRYRYTPGH